VTQDLTLGLDLGGTQVRAAIVGREGQILRRAAALTDVRGGPRAITAQMLSLSLEVMGSDRARVRAAGVSSPGPLDSDSGHTLDLPTLPGWTHFPLRQTLTDKLGLSVIIENDGIAAANGEWKFGAGRGLKHLVYVTVSTGIGGGVVVDNHLMRGRRGMAGHVGHMSIEENGPVCGCGNPGCFEALASGTAFNKVAQSLGYGNAKPLTEAARMGDEKALSAVHREALLLGWGFSSLLHLYSPEKLIVGGGVSSAFDLMLPTIKAEVQRRAMPAFRSVQIVTAELGDNAGLIGAASLAM
jgi:glucokinase